MAKRSKFFSAMSCFFTNDQKGKPLKKPVQAKMSKSERNRDLLISSHILHTASKPKHHLQTNTTKPENTTEIIDLTTEENNSLFPITIHILDGSQNTAPILLHLEIDPLKSNDDSNTSQCCSAEEIIKPEKTPEDGILNTVSVMDEQSVDDSMLVDNVFVQSQIDAFKNDVPLLKQSIFNDVDLSRDEDKVTTCCNDQMYEIKENENEVEKEKRGIDNTKKYKKGRNKREDFHASKIVQMNGSGSYFCSLCEVTLKEKKTVAAHIKKYKYVAPSFKCSVCDERFQWKGLLIHHLKEHFIDSDLEPNMVTDQTKTDISIKTESELDISTMLDITKDDHETFNNLEQKLKSNSSSVHSSLIKLISDTDRAEMNLACGYCDQCFNSQISLVKHCRTHMTDRPFMCNICGTLFKSNAALVYHTRIHFRMIRSRKKKASVPFIRYILRLHSCNECDRSYVSWSALNQHKRNDHSVSVERFVCEICGRVYFTKGHLNYHLNRSCRRTKTLDEKKVKKGFACKICDRRFRQNTTLRKHELKTHF